MADDLNDWLHKNDIYKGLPEILRHAMEHDELYIVTTKQVRALHLGLNPLLTFNLQNETSISYICCSYRARTYLFCILSWPQCLRSSPLKDTQNTPRAMHCHLPAMPIVCLMSVWLCKYSLSNYAVLLSPAHSLGDLLPIICSAK